jgi:hypothetical protein
MNEIIFEVRTMVKDAVNCHFDESIDAPKLIQLHFVRDELKKK